MQRNVFLWGIFVIPYVDDRRLLIYENSIFTKHKKKGDGFLFALENLACFG